jgi:diadenosine tetraphosphate (Ap4A) HIT family hydrolase
MEPAAPEVPANPKCRSCLENNGVVEPVHGVVLRNALWLVRHSPPPYGLKGWMVVQPIRHIASPVYFNDEEATDYGRFLRHCERILQETTGAIRMYTAALGEGAPHLHTHMVPRYADMPLGLKGWSVFDVHRLAEAGELLVDPQDVETIVQQYRQALSEDPPS